VVGWWARPGLASPGFSSNLKRILPKVIALFLRPLPTLRRLHAYLPFLDVLRAYFDIEEGDREYVIKKKMTEKAGQLDAKLKESLPPIEDILSLKVRMRLISSWMPRSESQDIRGHQRRTHQGEPREPLVIAVEDLHWVDKTSEEFLGYLIGFLANAQIMLFSLPSGVPRISGPASPTTAR